MYNNAYNREIKKKFDDIYKRQIEHEKMINTYYDNIAPPPEKLEGQDEILHSTFQDSGYDYVIKPENSKHYRKMGDREIEETFYNEDKHMKPQTKKDKEDEKMGEEIEHIKSKLEGGMKKSTKFRKSRQTKKDKEDEKQAMEIKKVDNIINEIKDNVKEKKIRKIKAKKDEIDLNKMEGGMKKIRKMRQTKKDKEHEKLGEELKQMDDKVKDNDTIKDIMEGVAKLKKGKGGMSDRKVGGGSIMVGGEKKERKPNPYLTLMKKVLKEHPELKGVKQGAKYIKDNNLYQKEKK